MGVRKFLSGFRRRVYVPATDIMAYLPRAALPDYTLERLTHFTAALDEVLVYDAQADTVRFNEPVLSTLLQNPIFFPKTFSQVMLRESEEDLRVMGVREGGESLDWEQVRAYVPVIQPITVDEFREFGLPENPSMNQAHRFLTSFDSRLADATSRISPAQLRNLAEAYCAPGLEIPRSPDEPLQVTDPHSAAGDFTSCLRRHLGFWATIGVIAAVGAVIIIGTGTAPVTTPLIIWLTATRGGGTAGIVVGCLRDPFW
jgi:hypothetical protein